MIRLAAISAVVLLAACELEEQKPAEPSPEMLMLMSACQEGRLDACAMVEDFRAREDARRKELAAAWVLANPMQSPQIYFPPMR